MPNANDEFLKDIMPAPTYSIYTQKNLKLHKRSLCILEMIEICENRIADYRSYLNKPHSVYYHITKDYYQKNVTRHLAIKQRLISYYADVMQRLIEPVINNARILGTITINELGKAIILNENY